MLHRTSHATSASACYYYNNKLGFNIKFILTLRIEQNYNLKFIFAMEIRVKTSSYTFKIAVNQCEGDADNILAQIMTFSKYI